MDEAKIKRIAGLILGLVFAAISGLDQFYFAARSIPAPWWVGYSQWVIGQVGISLGLTFAMLKPGGGK